MANKINFYGGDWRETKSRILSRLEEIRERLEDLDAGETETQQLRGQAKALRDIIFWELDQSPSDAG